MPALSALQGLVGWLWIVSILVFAGSLTEILLRHSERLRGASLLYLYMTRWKHLEPRGQGRRRGVTSWWQPP